MQSIVIASRNAKQQEELTQALLKEYDIHTFDRYSMGTESQSIGIEEIRKLQENLFLKPIRGKMKAVIVSHAENLTHQAQNAFLKILEEPPLSTLIVLVTKNKELLLPTILSRCFIIEKNAPKNFTVEELAQAQKILQTILSENDCAKLTIAEELSREKDELSLWFEKAIVSLRQSLLVQTDNQKHLIFIIRKFQKYHILLTTTNVNSRFLLENLFLSLS